MPSRAKFYASIPVMIIGGVYTAASIASEIYLHLAASVSARSVKIENNYVSLAFSAFALIAGLLMLWSSVRDRRKATKTC